MSKYDSIIDMSRPRSAHLPMSLYDRAAQFSPFAALTGHGAAVKEAARITDRRIALSDEETAELDRSFAVLKTKLYAKPAVKVVYFLPDPTKESGSYTSCTGHARSIDEIEHLLIFDEGLSVKIDDISSIDLLD